MTGQTDFGLGRSQPVPRPQRRALLFLLAGAAALATAGCADDGGGGLGETVSSVVSSVGDEVTTSEAPDAGESPETSEAPETTDAPETTAAPETTDAPETTAASETTEAETTEAAAAETTTEDEADEPDGTNWPLIIAIVAAGVALIAVVVVATARRRGDSGAALWRTRAADVYGHGMVVADLVRTRPPPGSLASDDRWVELDQRLNELNAQVRSLQASGLPTESAGSVEQLRIAVGALSSAVATDRQLRTNPEAGAEELGRAESTVNVRLDELDTALHHVAAMQPH